MEAVAFTTHHSLTFIIYIEFQRRNKNEKKKEEKIATTSNSKLDSDRAVGRSRARARRTTFFYWVAFTI